MNVIKSCFEELETGGSSKCSSWREYWKWPEFQSLTHHAMLQKKEPGYFKALITELELAEAVGGPIAVRATILQHRRVLHEAEWDAA